MFQASWSTWNLLRISGARYSNLLRWKPSIFWRSLREVTWEGDCNGAPGCSSLETEPKYRGCWGLSAGENPWHHPHAGSLRAVGYASLDDSVYCLGLIEEVLNEMGALDQGFWESRPVFSHLDNLFGLCALLSYLVTLEYPESSHQGSPKRLNSRRRQKGRCAQHHKCTMLQC